MATLSAGFSLSCKIEYYWLPLILAYVFLFVKPLNKSELLKSLLAFCIFPLLCAGILFVQGINLIDIAHAAEIIKKSAFVPAMMRFHAQIGIYPNPKLLLENLTGLFNLILILVCLYFVFFSEKIKKIFKWLIAACLFIFIGDVHYFAYFPIICAVFTLLNIKKIYNKPAGILAFAGIGASLKTFYSLHLDAYGSYTLPLVLLALLVLIFECYNFNKEKLQKFYVFVLALFAGFYFIFGLSKNIIYPQGKISGAGGSLIVHKEYIEPLNSIADYIKTNTAPSDRILVYPEGEVINILTGRKTDNMLYSLHPIFIETFGQDNIVNRINNEKIEYIVYIEGLMEAVWAPGKYEKLNNFIKSEYERIYFVPMTEPLHGISLYKLRSR
jgi:hypothetical protein